MSIEWLGPAAEQNYMVGRDGGLVTGTICHWIGTGTLDGAVAHFKNPNAGVSAHFVVGTTGRVVQVVDLTDTAYHAGNFDANLSTIGIEHEVTREFPPTDALYAASAWLHRKLSNDFGFPLVESVTVRPHNFIVPTQCPGALDLARIVKEATDLYVTLEAFEQYKAALEKQLNDQYVRKDESVKSHYHDVPLSGVPTSGPK